MFYDKYSKTTNSAKNLAILRTEVANETFEKDSKFHLVKY